GRSVLSFVLCLLSSALILHPSSFCPLTRPTPRTTPPASPSRGPCTRSRRAAPAPPRPGPAARSFPSAARRDGPPAPGPPTGSPARRTARTPDPSAWWPIRPDPPRPPGRASYYPIGDDARAARAAEGGRTPRVLHHSRDDRPLPRDSAS